MRIQYNAAWLLYLSSFAFAGPVNDSHIQEKDGYYYLQKGYTDKDAAEFYWRSLEGWSEVPDNVSRYFTKNGRFELPYAPVHDFPYLFSSASGGRDNITRYFSNMSQYLGKLKYSAPETWAIIPAKEPGLYIFEYSSRGQVRLTGKDYRQQFIAIVKIQNGQISRAREYWDPYVALRDFDLIKKAN